MGDTGFPVPASEAPRLSNGDSRPRQAEKYLLFAPGFNCDIQDVAGEKSTPSMSFKKVCVAAPICRRLLKSFVAFALSRTRVKAGSASATMIMMIATTTSNSISVKARGEFLTIKFFNLAATILVFGRK